ncbi:helix-turn-helix domain-containing protein [uncultured Secundilactobacillus sp.]|uniref:helix-turn-helix domain-containing protein n=1 Tax=uncultured Secundilactobacillus sp. TaxID=2813935 RepID=UPI0025845175|nr:helix-turn-helix transcriptional regulator [uncultured Secundilactobacillus sp.]
MTNNELNIENIKMGNGTVGQMIRGLRDYQHLTMSQLAFQSKVSQSYISQLENDARLPSENVIKKLAHALAWARSFDPTGFEPDKDGNTQNLSDFDAENLEMDLINGFKLAKSHAEARQMQKDYLVKLQESGDKLTEEQREITLSQADLNLLKKSERLSESGKEALDNFLDYLLSKEK